MVVEIKESKILVKGPLGGVTAKNITPSVNELVLQRLTQIDSALRSLQERIDSYTKTPTTVKAKRITVDTAGTAKQFSPDSIPINHAVVIKALNGNTDTVYIAGSKIDAEDASRSYPLEAGEVIEYKIKDLSTLWVNADVAGEGIVWSAEIIG